MQEGFRAGQLRGPQTCVNLGLSLPPVWWSRSDPHGGTVATTVPGVAKRLPNAIHRKTFWELRAPSPHTSPARAGHKLTCSQCDWLPSPSSARPTRDRGEARGTENKDGLGLATVLLPTCLPPSCPQPHADPSQTSSSLEPASPPRSLQHLSRSGTGQPVLRSTQADEMKSVSTGTDGQSFPTRALTWRLRRSRS